MVYGTGGVPTVSANGVLERTIGRNARVNLTTGACVSSKTLIPSRIMVNVLGSEVTRSSYGGKFVLSNFPHAIPRTRTLSEVNIAVSGIIRVCIPSRAVTTELSKEEIYRDYNGSCRIRCGPAGIRNVYGAYNNGMIVHGSSRPTAILSELHICRRGATPLGSCCSTRNGLAAIVNRRRITSADGLALTTVRTWMDSDGWSFRSTSRSTWNERRRQQNAYNDAGNGPPKGICRKT